MIHILWLLSHPHREGIYDLHLHVFQWIFTNFIQHNKVKYARWGTNCLCEINQSPQKIQHRLRQQICRKALFGSIQSDNQTRIRTRNALGALVRSDEINSESQTFHQPSADGPRPLTFDPILPMKLYSSLVSEPVMNTAPTDNKTPRGRMKCDSHHESDRTLLAVLLIFSAF